MTAILPDAAARIRAITALLTSPEDPRVQAWARDHKPRDCGCPWRWNRDAQAWQREAAATCGVHRG